MSSYSRPRFCRCAWPESYILVKCLDSGSRLELISQQRVALATVLGIKGNLGGRSFAGDKLTCLETLLSAIPLHLVMAAQTSHLTDDLGGQQSKKRKISRLNSVSNRHSLSRKRAVVACQPCRAKKAKCDNQRPACSRCQAQESECIYEDAAANAS